MEDGMLAVLALRQVRHRLGSLWHDHESRGDSLAARYEVVNCTSRQPEQVVVGSLWPDSWQHVALVKLCVRASHRLLSLIITENVVGGVDGELVAPHCFIIKPREVLCLLQEDLLVDDPLDMWQARAVHRVK